jgi:general secretion pathway protein K
VRAPPRDRRGLPDGSRRGAALALALWLVVALGALAATVVAAARDAVGTTINLRARVAARYAAESGVTVAVRAVDDALARLATDARARQRYLNGLEAASVRAAPEALGEARFQAVLVDASARLDVNAADADALATLFARVGSAAQARAAAEAIARWTGAPGLEAGGAARGMVRARPIRSLDELARIPGVPLSVARAAAPYLTIDGDGQVNRAGAAEPVRAAARGGLVDEPTRIVIVSRGWTTASPLTHEIQAVYAVRGNRLAFVRWRERDL